MLRYCFLILPVFSARYCDYYWWRFVELEKPLLTDAEVEALTRGFKRYCNEKIGQEVPIMYLRTNPMDQNPMVQKIHDWVYGDCSRNIPDTIIFKVYYRPWETWDKVAYELAKYNDFQLLYKPLCKILNERPHFACTAFTIEMDSWNRPDKIYYNLFCAFCGGAKHCTSLPPSRDLRRRGLCRNVRSVNDNTVNLDLAQNNMKRVYQDAQVQKREDLELMSFYSSSKLIY